MFKTPVNVYDILLVTNWLSFSISEVLVTKECHINKLNFSILITKGVILFLAFGKGPTKILGTQQALRILKAGTLLPLLLMS